MVRVYVYLAVLVSGASVLAIEILGTRIIAPAYGVGLYVWSALISVTLAALSIGYAVGGHWADRGPVLHRFAATIGLAGLWIVAIPWLRHPVLGASELLGLRAGVLLVAAVLFLPPLALLGMVSPYAIRLLASSLGVVGRTAGHLYAASTVASVLSAVATGFVLIPAVGVSTLVFWVGILLVLTALAGFAAAGRYKPAWALLLLIPAGGLGLRAAHDLVEYPGTEAVALTHSAYAEIRVVDRGEVRYMLLDGGTHTIADRRTWVSEFAYVHVLDLAKGYFAGPGDMLLVGLGGGSVVKSFARDGWKVAAVEIDPVVVRMARAHFGLVPEEATVHEMDGRRFLLSTDGYYDLIVMDAFGTSSIPFHLVTVEAFGLMRSRLRADGVLAVNLEAHGWHDPLVHALAVTAQQAFSHVLVLPMAEPPDRLGNLVLFASDRSLELPAEPPLPQGRFSVEYHRAHAWDNRFAVDPAGVTVLTDELNPVDIWADRISRVARSQLHALFQAQKG